MHPARHERLEEAAALSRIERAVDWLQKHDGHVYVAVIFGLIMFLLLACGGTQ